MAEMYYRKQWVEALQFWPGNWDGVNDLPIIHLGGRVSYLIRTADGETEIVPGDWIVCEEGDAIHIVPPDTFAAEYTSGERSNE